MVGGIARNPENIYRQRNCDKKKRISQELADEEVMKYQFQTCKRDITSLWMITLEGFYSCHQQLRDYIYSIDSYFYEERVGKY